MSQVSIVGAYNSKFGSLVKKEPRDRRDRRTSQSLHDLVIEAGGGALADAGIEGKDVDGVWVGSCAPGQLANQEHLAAFATEIDPDGLRFKSMTRCEDACASGSVALYDALYAVEAGRARVALVVGAEKMNLLDTKGVTHALATCSYWPEEGGEGRHLPRPVRRVRPGLPGAPRPRRRRAAPHARDRRGARLPERRRQPARALRQGRPERQARPLHRGSDPGAPAGEEPGDRRAAAPPRLLARHGRRCRGRDHADRRRAAPAGRTPSRSRASGT